MPLKVSQYGATAALIIFLGLLAAGVVLVCLSHQDAGELLIAAAIGHATGAAAVAGSSEPPPA